MTNNIADPTIHHLQKIKNPVSISRDFLQQNYISSVSEYHFVKTKNVIHIVRYFFVSKYLCEIFDTSGITSNPTLTNFTIPFLLRGCVS